jgi:hypothetical protein
MKDTRGKSPTGSAESHVGSLVARFEGLGTDTERSQARERPTAARYLSASPVGVRHPTAMPCAQASPRLRNFVDVPRRRVERPNYPERRDRRRHAPTLLQAHLSEKGQGCARTVADVGSGQDTQETSTTKARRCNGNEGAAALMELVSLFDDALADWDQEPCVDRHYLHLPPRGLSADWAASTMSPTPSTGAAVVGSAGLLELERCTEAGEGQRHVDIQGDDALHGSSAPPAASSAGDVCKPNGARQTKSSISKDVNDWNVRWQPRQRAAQMRALALQHLTRHASPTSR